MRWSPEQISAKAEALQARGPGRITLSADTVLMIVIALRLLAAARPARRLDAYVVQMWSGHPDDRGEAVAMADKWVAAKAAFEAVCREHPRYRVTLRQGGRVVSVRDSTTVRW